MADDRYDRIIFRGVTVDKFTRQALQAVEKKLGYELTLWQGSYHKGVSKSAGTHDGGGTVDLNGYYDATRKTHAMRDCGFVADLRNQPSLSMEIHAVQIGNTKASPSAKAQVAPMMRGRAGLARDVPQVIKYTPAGGYKPWPYHPEPEYRKPSASGDLFTVATYNLALYNTRGKDSFTKRRGRIVANVQSSGADVLCVQEAGFAELAYWDKAFGKLGLVRAPGGSDGRYIYFRDGLFVLQESGVFALYPEYQGDDKQATWAVLKYNASEFFFSSFHLEEAVGAVPDKYRPKQMESLFSQADKVCDQRHIPSSRRILNGDTNSTKLVKDQMWKAHRFVPASKNAAKVVNYAYATFNNWVRKAKGGHIDYIFVDHTRPVVEWNQIASAASDHNLVFALIGRA